MMNLSIGVGGPSYPAMAPPPPPWMLPSPNLPLSNSFWETNNVKERLRDLQDTLLVAKAMKSELQMRLSEPGYRENAENLASEISVCKLSEHTEGTTLSWPAQESLCVEAAKSLISKLGYQLEPFRLAADEAAPWEEKSVAIGLADKVKKCKRNKQWRKKKRKHVAEMLAKEREQFDQVDQKADEWRVREIAKDIGKRKVEKMKGIAKLKAKEEKRQLESELELVLIVEKLQELRTIRIEKLKKQGHFLPEEDNKFLERVRAAVEEEERQAMVAAATDTTKEAIATAEESRRLGHSSAPTKDDDGVESQTHRNDAENKIKQSLVTNTNLGKQGSAGHGFPSAYDSLPDLPIEFYHYYHGSNIDMGTLIEVRRTWDAYIRQGGSRIPGHWVEPPPPTDEVWASYLVHK